ncbi:MAG: hypothetical protein R3B37_13370 [Nitrospira sp.]|nr:hypothetical protein [Nitrospira sp.]
MVKQSGQGAQEELVWERALGAAPEEGVWALALVWVRAGSVPAVASIRL